MKAWQIFGIGTLALLALLFLPIYERVIAGAAACVLLTTVIYGFMLNPERDVFHVRTRVPIFDPDGRVVHERGLVAIKVEVARLWLLFLPTFAAMAFLVITAARGTTWTISLLERLLGADISYPMILGVRLIGFATVGILSAWIGERRGLRQAEAVTAKSVSRNGGRVGYFFVDPTGSYYGGETFTVDLVKPAALARIVFYDVKNPAHNKIAMSFVFHRLVILGHGLTDLDHETVETRSLTLQPGRT